MTKRSSTKQLHDPWVFFTDRDLGKAVPNALARAGYSVERHDDHFGPLTDDPTWLRAVAERGWIALTHNKKIGTTAMERDAAMRSGLALFFLIGKLTHDQLAANLVATMPRVIALREQQAPPFIARVYRPDPPHAIGARAGRVELWVTGDLWRAP